MIEVIIRDIVFEPKESYRVEKDIRKKRTMKIELYLQLLAVSNNGVQFIQSSLLKVV